MKTAFESFIEPARARSGMWRLILGLGCIAIGLVIWLVVVVMGFWILIAPDGMSLRATLDAVRLASTSSDTRGLIFQFFLFLGIWPSVWLVVRFLHKQHFSTLFAPAGRFRLRDFFYGLLLAFALCLAITLPVVLVYGLPDRSALTLASWTITLLPLIVVLGIQAGAEELVFRGYILQQLAVRWRSPIAWASVSSILFILIHGTTGNYLYIISLFAYGLGAAALVWRTGSLLVPIGLHFGVNFFGFYGIGYEWSKFNQSQLFVFQETNKSATMTSQAAAMILLLLFVVSPLFPQRQPAERRISEP